MRRYGKTKTQISFATAQADQLLCHYCLNNKIFSFYNQNIKSLASFCICTECVFSTLAEMLKICAVAHITLSHFPNSHVL